MNNNIGFEQTWRWYGPNDRITLNDVRQTGATGIVTALHQIPVGETWTLEDIQDRKQMIEDKQLTWSVVESVPVSEDIKKRSGDYELHIENYKRTLENLGKCGVQTVCYNFMPILDWSRTNLNFGYTDGSSSLRYENHIFAAFDLYILKREAAVNDYPASVIEKAKVAFEAMSAEEKQKLSDTILQGLPGSFEGYTLEAFTAMLNSYKNIGSKELKENLIYFLEQIVPICENYDIKLAIHPDDPPWSLLGLPRVVGSYTDFQEIFETVPSPSNGLTLCTGSLGAGYENDLNKISKDFAHRVHFAHLRNVERDVDKNFREDCLFEGDIDILEVSKNLLKESIKRSKTDRKDVKIPMRPDHGYQMLDDIKKENYPGYGLYGRMKGLAEIRGLEMGLLNTLS